MSADGGGARTWLGEVAQGVVSHHPPVVRHQEAGPVRQVQQVLFFGEGRVLKREGEVPVGAELRPESVQGGLRESLS